jgi:hypothetical protein
MSPDIESMKLFLSSDPLASIENAFMSYVLSAIPLTTISTNLGIIGTGVQSKLR